MKIIGRSGATIYEAEARSIKELVESAVKGWVNLKCADLRDANLAYVNLDGANLIGADLRGADLIDANLIDANLIDANLRGANLAYANLEGVNFRGADLRGADLVGANLWEANLEDTNLDGADLRGATLSHANLKNTNLNRANLKNVKITFAVGNSKEIKSILNTIYPITYTKDQLAIGCEQYSMREWKNFSDREILKLDGKEGLKWWKEWRDFLFLAIDKSFEYEDTI
ncbi:pentapeptide repeat-containing protein [Hydrogenimonas sp.]